MLCRHCARLPASRPRSLCWICYSLPDVRSRYPPKNKHGRRGIGNFYKNTSLPPFPTQALPGTPEKIAVLAERARMSVQLWHPDDAPLDRRYVAKNDEPAA